MAADPLADFAKDLRGLAADLTGPGMERTLKDIGVDAVESVGVAVARDIGGDRRMSNWPRARFDARATPLNANELKIAPTPQSRGPVHVAEFGRRAGMSRGRKGGRRAHRNFASARAVASAPRKVSASRGLNTWSDAGRELERLGPVVEARITRLIERWLR